MKSLKLVLEGNIVSNKNSFLARLSNAIITAIREIPRVELHDTSKTNLILKQLAKYIRLTHTKEYKEWFKEAKKQIMDQIEYEPFFDRVKMEFIIYFPKRGISGGDISNKWQSVEDLLTNCGIINDDNYECLCRIEGEGVYRENRGGAEINIIIL